MRIMLVDDHPGFRQLVKTLLQTTGVEFGECEDGEAEVREYAQFRPELVHLRAPAAPTGAVGCLLEDNLSQLQSLFGCSALNSLEKSIPP